MVVRVQEHDGVDALLLLGVGAHLVFGAVQVEPVLNLKKAGVPTSFPV